MDGEGGGREGRFFFSFRVGAAFGLAALFLFRSRPALFHPSPFGQRAHQSVTLSQGSGRGGRQAARTGQPAPAVFANARSPFCQKGAAEAPPLLLCRRVPRDTSSMLKAAQARPHAIARRWPTFLSFFGGEARRASSCPPFLLPAAPSRISASPPSTLPPSTQHQFNRHAWWAAGGREAKGAAQSPLPPPPTLATIGRELGRKNPPRAHTLFPLSPRTDLFVIVVGHGGRHGGSNVGGARALQPARGGVETNAARRRTSGKQQAKCRHPHGHTHSAGVVGVCGGGQKKARAPKGRGAAFLFVLRL